MKKIFVGLSFLLPFVVYILTLAPDVYFTDSGELASVAASLGIAHPTGYPLFTLVGYLWANILPFSPIYNLNLFAAFTTAVSSVFLFLSITLLFQNANLKKRIATQVDENKHNLLASFITLGYSYGLTIWQQATSVEVYSLQLMLITCFIYLILKSFFTEKSKSKYLILSGFTLGLGFANHLTSFMLIPLGLIVFFSVTKDYNKNVKWKLFGFVIAAAISGVLLYLYLPIRSAQHPIFNWGEVHRSFDKFMYHVTGAQYQVWMFSDSAAWKENFKLFFELIPNQITWIGVAFFVYGLFVAFKSNKTIFIGLLSTILLCLFYSLNYSIHDIDSYFLTAYIAIFLFLAIAALQIVYYQKHLLFLFLFIPLFNLYSNYNQNDLSEDYTVSEYYNFVSKSAEKDAIIISAQWDFWVSAYWYKSKIEDERLDISFVEKELLRRTWYINSLQQWTPKLYSQCKENIDLYMEQLEKFESDKPYDQRLIQSRFINMINCFIDSNFGKRPIYLTIDVLQSEPDIAKNYVKIPEGFLIRLSKSQDQIKFDYKSLEIDKFANSVDGKTDKLHSTAKSLALVNLQAGYNYSKFTNDIETANTITQLINKLNEPN